MSVETEEIRFNTQWREQYIASLESKLEFLNTRIRIGKEFHKDPNTIKGIFTDDRISIKDLYEFHAYSIEALELEHRIYYEKKALRDWKSQVERTSVHVQSSKMTEAIQNFEKVLRIVEAHADKHERLKKLLADYNAMSSINDEQREILYAHFTRSLEMLMIPIQ